MSNIPAASSGERTGYSIERVLSSASTSNAIARDRRNWLHRSQSGRYASTASSSIRVANASFSQIPFHQRIVTRSPNHMCASSCAITSATVATSGWVALSGFTSRRLSR